MGGIALFVGSLNGGGAERMMVNHANGFSELGCDTTLICSDFTGPYTNELDKKVKVKDLRSSGVLSSLLSLYLFLRQLKPDYLLVTQSHSSLVAIIATKIFPIGVKVIIREASTPSQTKSVKTSLKARIVDFLLKPLYKKADGYVALSQGAKQDMVNYYRLIESRIEVINNPVVTPMLLVNKDKPVQHAFLKPDREHLALIGVGRISEVKDYGTMIKALKHVNKTQEAKLLILGKYSEEGWEFKKLKHLVESLNINDKVDFLGFEENPFAYMSQSDVFVLSSLYEGMPGVLVQAMACGCQCVSTDCKSGPSEVLEDGQLGRLAPVGDHIRLGDAILDIANNPVDKNLLVAKAGEFSYLTSSQSYLNYFNSLNK